MLNHAIDNMTTAQEDGVLTKVFEPIAPSYRARAGLSPNHYQDPCVGCLLMASGQVRSWGNQELQTHHVGMRYEHLAARFGVERTNNAIRNRILSNRARRTLQNRPTQQLESVSR